MENNEENGALEGKLEKRDNGVEKRSMKIDIKKKLAVKGIDEMSVKELKIEMKRRKMKEYLRLKIDALRSKLKKHQEAATNAILTISIAHSAQNT